MLYKAIDSITESDLQALVTEGRREDTQLEFKLTMPGNSDDEKKEFLKDVSAMANSQGGDIVYGVREDRSNPDDAGKAAEVVGITGVGADAAKLWMSELLNSSIEERMIGVAFRDVQLSAGGFALVVRVPRSWNAPHVVRHKNHWRFYGRNSAGVYAMNVTDLRTAFLLSDTLTQQLESVRTERLSHISAMYPNVVLNKDWSNPDPAWTSSIRTSLLIIHLQPFESVKSGFIIDMTQARTRRSNLRLLSDFGGESNMRVNFDGLRIEDSTGYLQIFRSGMTEEVASNVLLDTYQNMEVVDATDLDRAILKGVGQRLALLKSLGVTSPVLVSISLLGVKGCKLLINVPFYVGDVQNGVRQQVLKHPIDRKDLFLTGIVVENLHELSLEGDDKIPDGWVASQGLMRSYCDLIWNAAGSLTSAYFDSEGRWMGQVVRQ